VNCKSIAATGFFSCLSEGFFLVIWFMKGSCNLYVKEDDPRGTLKENDAEILVVAITVHSIRTESQSFYVQNYIGWEQLYILVNYLMSTSSCRILLFNVH